MPVPEDWNILITGVTSIHGWPIYQRIAGAFAPQNVFGIRPPKTGLPAWPRVEAACITDRDSLGRMREMFRPTHVMHCAGVCDLDACEDRPDWAYSMNVEGTRAVCDVFGDLPIFYMSTDLVFSGEDPPGGGYSEDDVPDPVSVAGKTFAEAERMLAGVDRSCIVRLGLPLGDSVTGGKGAVDWIESRFKRQLPVTLFHDEYRSCVSCGEIANMALRALSEQWTGLYHFGGERAWSLHEIGVYVMERGGYDPALLRGILRRQEVNGPPRIGNVSLNSERCRKRLQGAQ